MEIDRAELEAKIPANVKTPTPNVNILKGASDEFILMVATLEDMTDLNERAAKAQEYIQQLGGITSIDYPQLGQFLKNPKTTSTRMLQQLYLLERSIPPRSTSYSWWQRLKIFYNNYLTEMQVPNHTWEGHTLYLQETNKDGIPTNHDKLCQGRGEYISDFYYNDENGKKIDVELKQCRNGEEGLEYYGKNTKFLYKTKLLILYASYEHCYYMADYRQIPATLTKLDIPAPEGRMQVIYK